MGWHQTHATRTTAVLSKSAQSGPGPVKSYFRALGTHCEIQYEHPDPEAGAEFARAAKSWTLHFETTYSRFRPDSLISRINQAAGIRPIDVDTETESLLQLVDGLYFLTQGVLDPSTLPLTLLWDFKNPNPRIPTSHEVETARRLCGWPKIARSGRRIYLPEKGMGLDFGGFGKEYAVDRVIELARQHGCTAALVDFGHDVACYGKPSHAPCWHIGLENPTAPGTAWGSVVLQEGAVASSGNYLRGFMREGKRYGHIIDPRTGYPVTNEVEATYIIHGTCLEAGILSTSCYILGPKAGLDLLHSTYGAAGCILTSRERLFTANFTPFYIPLPNL